LRVSVLIAFSVASTGFAHAESVRVEGKVGYLSEWQLSATVTKSATNEREYSGPAVIRHVGLCAPGHPVEMTGTLRYTVVPGWMSSRLVATISLDGKECSFEGKWSGTYEGALSCDAWRGVPLSLSAAAH
jgi:hypothetical protein